MLNKELRSALLAIAKPLRYGMRYNRNLPAFNQVVFHNGYIGVTDGYTYCGMQFPVIGLPQTDVYAVSYHGLLRITSCLGLKEEVAFRLEHTHLSIISGGKVFNIALFGNSDLPSLTHTDGGSLIASTTFGLQRPKQVAALTVYDDFRPVMAQVCVNALGVCATDAHVLWCDPSAALVDPIHDDLDGQVMVPAHVVKHLQPDIEYNLDIYPTVGHLNYGGMHIRFTREQGRFPKYDKIMPAADAPYVMITVDKAVMREFFGAARGMASSAHEHKCFVAISSKRLNIRMFDDGLMAVFNAAMPIKEFSRYGLNDNVVFSVNPSFMMRVIDALPDRLMRILFYGGNKAILLQVEDSTEKGLVMPIMIFDDRLIKVLDGLSMEKH